MAEFGDSQQTALDALQRQLKEYEMVQMALCSELYDLLLTEESNSGIEAVVQQVRAKQSKNTLNDANTNDAIINLLRESKGKLSASTERSRELADKTAELQSQLATLNDYIYALKANPQALTLVPDEPVVPEVEPQTLSVTQQLAQNASALDRTFLDFWEETGDTVNYFASLITQPLFKVEMPQPATASTVGIQQSAAVGVAEEIAAALPGSGSSAVTQTIHGVRNKYIIGKLAGEKLYDQNGNIIIEKDAVITEEVIQQAEHEGKLVDLIMNMRVAGLDD